MGSWTASLVLACVVLKLANGQHSGLAGEENQVLLFKLETLKAQFEDFVQVEFGRLKEEVKQLQVKVHEQEILLSSCAPLPPIEKSIDGTLNRGIVGSETRAAAKSGMPRSCNEARLADPSLTSGVHWIDPDGQGVGDDPIQVYCDMSSGVTSIGHDTEASTDVGHCLDPGCYTKSVTYEASLRQMSALIELSGECRQSIRYDCYSAPMEFNEIAYSWWNDRSGNAQYFWSGNNDTVHTCQCGILNSCIDPNLKCNCDALATLNVYDEGYITKKELLPITRLNFGRTATEASSGIHTLGKLQCSGQKIINGMPTSCQELWQIGHVLSGLYLIKGVSQVETVYCDFSKLFTDQGYQTWIGFADIKSSPVYFYVQRTTDYINNGTVIPFEETRLNIGNAMDLSTGIFEAPVSGKYFFSFSGINLSSTSGLRVYLQLNGVALAGSFGEGMRNSVGQTDTASFQSTLQLQKGDKINLFLATGVLHDASSHYNHFVGILLEETVF